MKRNFFVIVLLAIILAMAVVASAEESAVSTTMYLKNDLSYPDSGGGPIDTQRAFLFWYHKKSNVGVGLDLAYSAGDEDYFQVDPNLSYNWGPWYAVAGLAADNFSRHVQAGFWYINTIGKTFILADLRNYFAASGNAGDYVEGYLEVTHPVGGKFFAGIDLDYCRYYSKDHDWLLVGPLVGYKFNQSVSAFVRFSKDDDDAKRVRLVLKLNF